MDQDIKIQQSILLAKGARGRGLTEIIAKATADPGVFGFGELLDVPSIKELQGTELAPHYALLQLFAYGTWSDYQANASSLPPLSEAQVLKLKQLTVASLAASQKLHSLIIRGCTYGTQQILPYSQLQSELQIGSVRELEDFLINHCFYGGVIAAGKLDQKQGCLQVHDVVGRDVRPEHLADLTQRMARWIVTGDELLRAIEARVTYTSTTSEAARVHREELDAKVEEVKRQIKADVRANDMLDDGSLLDLMEEDRVGLLAAPMPLMSGHSSEGPGGSGSAAGGRSERSAGRPKRRR